MAALDRRRNTTASRAAAKRHLAEAHRLERRARRCRCVIRSTQLRITWLAPSPGAIEVSRRVTCLRAPRPGRTVLFRPEVRTA
jgi:hypothetical protein